MWKCCLRDNIFQWINVTEDISGAIVTSGMHINICVGDIDKYHQSMYEYFQ